MAMHYCAKYMEFILVEIWNLGSADLY